MSIIIDINKLISLAIHNLDSMNYSDLSTYETALTQGVKDEFSCYLQNNYTLLEIMQDIDYSVERFLRDLRNAYMTPTKGLIYQEAWASLVHCSPNVLEDIHKAAVKSFSKTYTLTVTFRAPSGEAAQEVQNAFSSMWDNVAEELPEDVDYTKDESGAPCSCEHCS